MQSEMITDRELRGAEEERLGELDDRPLAHRTPVDLGGSHVAAGRTGIVTSFEHALEQKVLLASSFRCVSTLIYFLAATAIAP